MVDTFKQRENLDKYAYLASLEEIQENDFNLNIPLYVEKVIEDGAAASPPRAAPTLQKSPWSLAPR